MDEASKFSSSNARRAAWKIQHKPLEYSCESAVCIYVHLTYLYLFAEVLQVRSRVQFCLSSQLLQTHVSVHGHGRGADLQNGESGLKTQNHALVRSVHHRQKIFLEDLPVDQVGAQI